MITSKYDWQIATNFSDEDFIKKAKKLGLETSVANLVYQRGIQTEEALRDFLEVPYTHPPPPPMRPVQL